MGLFTLVAQHDDFIVIDKAPGVSVHKDDAEQGLLQVIQQELGLAELYLVHRLDKMTSGLLLLALNKGSASILSQLFAQRQVEKYYLALSDKKPKKKQGWIIGDMHKGRNGSWVLSKTKNKPAKTYFYSTFCEHGYRLFLLKPHTGKTHQLRVALKSLGAPIVGDERYHHKQEAKLFERAYLHAWRLAFTYQEQELCFECLPQQGCLFLSAEFTQALSLLLEKAKT